MSRTRKLPQKTPSERLRSILYRLYTHERPMITFDEYYEEKLETIINHFKTKLK